MDDLVTDSRITQFVTHLEGLSTQDRARLRGGAGSSLAEAPELFDLFYHVLPVGVPVFQEKTYFLLATLFPLTKKKGSGNLGACLRKANGDNTNKRLDRRIEILLNVDVDQLFFHLRQAIHFLQTKRVEVSWSILLQDLLNWDHPDRLVQKKWARAYYAADYSSIPPEGE